MAILIGGGSSPKEDAVPLVDVSLDSSVSGTAYAWNLYEKPAGSLAVISDVNIKAPSITPDLPGTYLLSLAVGSNDPVYGLLAVPHPLTGFRIPGAGEGDATAGGNLSSSTRGWAPALEQMLRSLSSLTTKGQLEVAYNGTGSAITRGKVVCLSGVQTLYSGGLAETLLPTAVLADGSSESLSRRLGVCLGGIDYSLYEGVSTSIANGAVGSVMIQGLLSGVDTSAFSAGDLLYASSTPGNLTNIPSVYARPVATVLVSDASAGVIYVGGIERTIGHRWDLRRVSGSVTPTAEEVDGAWFQFDTSGGVGDLTLPAGTSDLDGARCCVEQRGANTLTVNTSGDDVIAPAIGVTEDLAADGDVHEYTYDAEATSWVRSVSPISALGSTPFVVASQGEAEAGADNTKGMTPLRTAQAIAAALPFAVQAEVDAGVEAAKVVAPDTLGVLLAASIPALASQGEAEAGTNNTKTVTPLRVEQHFVAKFDSSRPPLFSVRGVPSVNLPASMLGNVLTMDSNGALTEDGIAYDAGDLVYLRQQDPASQNGLYRVTTVGDGGNPAELTRHEYLDLSAQAVDGTLVHSKEGLENADAIFRQTIATPFTLNTTPITASPITSSSRLRFLSLTGSQTLTEEQIRDHLILWTPVAFSTVLTLPPGSSSIEGRTFYVRALGSEPGALVTQGADEHAPGTGSSLALTENVTYAFSYSSADALWHLLSMTVVG